MNVIDPKEYLTMIQTAKKIGCPRRSLYRIIDRLGVAKVCTNVFGRRLVHKSMLPLIKAEYMPFGSDQRREMAVAAGAAGGTAKARNRERAASSGTTDAQGADSTRRRSRRAPSQ